MLCIRTSASICVKLWGFIYFVTFIISALSFSTIKLFTYFNTRCKKNIIYDIIIIT